jgi:carbon storage regulator
LQSLSLAANDRVTTAADQGGLHTLIPTRRVGETVTIGSEVTVTVLEVKGNKVRIGVNAPQELVLRRQEVAERIA